MSEENRLRAVKNMKLPTFPTDNFFKENLSKICLKLKSDTNAKIGLLSLPPIGEDLQHPALKRTTHYSEIIKGIASKQEITYLPLHEQMKEIIKNQNHSPKTSYGKNWKFIMYREIFFHYILSKSFDEISKANGFILLTDCLHLNRGGAEIIANLISEFIKN